jgi:hypothetical protein
LTIGSLVKTSNCRRSAHAAPRCARAIARADADYDRRASQELTRFAGEENVNDLPKIFLWWSNAYLRKHLEAFGRILLPRGFEQSHAALRQARLDRLRQLASRALARLRN